MQMINLSGYMESEIFLLHGGLFSTAETDIFQKLSFVD